MASESADSSPRATKDTPTAGLIYMWGVILPTLGWLAYRGFARSVNLLHPALIFWIAVLAAVELLPVPVSRTLQFSLSFPVRLGIAILYAPAVAAAIALIGSFDPRELRREIRPLRSLFNRS